MHVGRWPLAVGRWPLAVGRTVGHVHSRREASSNRASSLSCSTASGGMKTWQSMAHVIMTAMKNHENNHGISYGRLWQLWQLWILSATGMACGRQLGTDRRLEPIPRRCRSWSRSLCIRSYQIITMFHEDCTSTGRLWQTQRKAVHLQSFHIVSS